MYYRGLNDKFSSLYDNEQLFKRFFEKRASDWVTTSEYEPHMKMEYSEKDNDYIISANYKLSSFDKSLINEEKRKIDISMKIEEDDLLIDKYLFDIDLAKIIGVESIKNKLIEINNVISQKVAILYNQDRDLKVTTNYGEYLASANYELIIQNYEDIFNIFGPYKKTLNIDLSTFTFTESHEKDGIYFDGDPEIMTTTLASGNDDAKRLLRNLEK